MTRVKGLTTEPVAIVAAIQAVLVLLVSFGKLDAIGLHTQKDVALVVVVVGALGALYLAFSTHQPLLAPLTQLVQAGLALAVIYGFHITTEQTGMVIAALAALFGAFHRTQTSPVLKPV